MRMKKLLFPLLILLIFAAGALITLYPIIADKWAQEHQLSVVQQYNEVVQQVDRTEIENELALVDKYNRSLWENKVKLSDPFDPNAPDFPDGNYYELLNLTDTMAYIEIPKISVNLPIYHGTKPETLEKGVGHLEGTSLPAGGEGTHACLSAHSGLPTAKLFTDLSKLTEGDKFFIHVLDLTLAYEVDQITVVEPTDIKLLGIEDGQDYVTLITCTPYAVNTHRLLVRGTRIEYTEETHQEAVEAVAETELSTIEIVQRIAIAAGFLLFLILVIVLLKPKKYKGKHTKK